MVGAMETDPPVDAELPGAEPRLANGPRTVSPLDVPFGSRTPEPARVFAASEKAIGVKQRTPGKRFVAAVLVLVALGLLSFLVVSVVRQSSADLPRFVEVVPGYGTIVVDITSDDNARVRHDAVATDATGSVMSIVVAAPSTTDVGLRTIIKGNDVYLLQPGTSQWVVQRGVDTRSFLPTPVPPGLHPLSYFVPEEMRPYISVTGSHKSTIAGRAVTEYSLNVNTSAFEAARFDAYNAWVTRTGATALVGRGQLVVAVDAHGVVWKYGTSNDLGAGGATVTVLKIADEVFTPKLPA